MSIQQESDVYNHLRNQQAVVREHVQWKRNLTISSSQTTEHLR